MKRCIVEGFSWGKHVKEMNNTKNVLGSFPLWKPDIQDHSYSQTSIKQKISSAMEETNVIFLLIYDVSCEEGRN